ncbi:MAG: hypothetical protein Q7U54_20160 [Bacteroidales bacterium]|nr:hypothetical protein [Bacteroidales bacterium]
MKHVVPVLLLLFLGLNLKGQTLSEAKEGSVSFVTSQNVYVKFQSTADISVGDTLYVVEDSKRIPVLVVKDMSSISCVCIPVSAKKISVADKVLTQPKITQASKAEVDVIPVIVPATIIIDTASVKKELPEELKQNVSGRISVSSYSNFSNVSDFSQRMRYTFSLNARNIGGSKLSGESYISFVHKLNQWEQVKDNIFNGLKIYSLSFNYALNKNNNIWVGRKINPKLSNVGAIDGLQYETKIRSFTAGAFAGARPDYKDYSFNLSLLQYGGYIGHDYANQKGGSVQTSVAFVEQKNNGYIDRRFTYLQHSNSLLANLYFFGSAEFDLYNKERNITSQDTTYTQNNSPSLSNLYVSLRYKVIKQLSLSISYSNRQNIIYYETYKSIIDQLLYASTMQGYTFQVNFRPGKKISIGANAGYRFSKTDPKPSKNLYSYVTYSNVPWLNASATLSTTLMQTSYVNGSIYSLGLSRDIIPGKLYGGIAYRYVDYKFENNEMTLKQNMAEMDLTWSIMKKLSCSLNYEGTFEKGNNYERIYVNLTQRF